MNKKSNVGIKLHSSSIVTISLDHRKYSNHFVRKITVFIRKTYFLLFINKDFLFNMNVDTIEEAVRSKN